MYQYVLYCFRIFFVVLEVIVLFYTVQTIVNLGEKLRKAAIFLVAPILLPMQSLVRHSIMNTFSLDLSPYLLIIVLFYLENLCNYLLKMI